MWQSVCLLRHRIRYFVRPAIFSDYSNMNLLRQPSYFVPCAALILASMLPPANAATGLFDFSFAPLIPAPPIALRSHAGKVILIVNTASQCGYTPQYQGLEALHAKYAARGLVVMGFPSNDFGGQEPGSNKEIAQFCQANFGVSFLMTEKLATPIPQNPFYAQLIKASGKAPQWNFHKYLIGKSGKVTSYPSDIEPMSQELTTAVEAALAAK
jgi:glutathione peroxidase